MTCVIAYDIEDDKDRNKLARFLGKKGVRLQKSVFAVDVERHTFKIFTKKLEILAGESGKVAVFRLCMGCKRNAISLAMEENPFYVF